VTHVDDRVPRRDAEISLEPAPHEGGFVDQQTGDNIRLGMPFTFTKDTIDQFDF
jgi:hypothetical protein